MPYGFGLVGGGVVESVLSGVEDGVEGLQGGLGDLGGDGGLAGGLVPQDGDVEDLEQPGLEPGREAGQDVPGQRELVQQAGVGGGWGGPGQSLELGLQSFAFFVQFGETGADAGPVGLPGRVGGVGGEVFEFEDLGVLRGLDPGDPGVERGFAVLQVGCGLGVGGGEPGGEQGSPFESEHAGGEEPADDLVEEGFGGLDGAGVVVGVVGGVLGAVPGHSRCP